MKIGLIGAGNMASALLGGMLKSKMVKAEDVIISDKDSAKLSIWKEQGVVVCEDNRLVEEKSDLIIFAVKPNIIQMVMEQMQGDTSKIYLSIAAGVTLAFMEQCMGADKKLVRTMPNTPAMVGCGMTVVAPNKNITKAEEEKILNLLGSIGDAMILPEKELEIATALHGSSPAYVYMMLDAMADAGVRYGLTKANALRLAAKAVEGSAKMVLETGIHPQQLKDNVCSPGGTTIAAVNELERTGFCSSLQAGIDACIKRNQEMKQ
ncbi:MAG: pyrroline-5-carboxylate reductase [Clostridia bacterium]|nr:pyrroline-5-carboxylate reductase [Clostridia bacterium]